MCFFTLARESQRSYRHCKICSAKFFALAPPQKIHTWIKMGWNSRPTHTDADKGKNKQKKTKNMNTNLFVTSGKTGEKKNVSAQSWWIYEKTFQPGFTIYCVINLCDAAKNEELFCRSSKLKYKLLVLPEFVPGTIFYLTTFSTGTFLAN